MREPSNTDEESNAPVTGRAIPHPVTGSSPETIRPDYSIFSSMGSTGGQPKQARLNAKTALRRSLRAASDVPSRDLITPITLPHPRRTVDRFQVIGQLLPTGPN